MSKISKAIAEAIEFSREGKSVSFIQNFLENAIDTVEVKVYRDDKSQPLPHYGKDGDACMDVHATKIEWDKEKARWICHTGLHFELPKDYEMELRPRSSNTKFRVAMLNSPATLDEGYRGELLVIFTCVDKDAHPSNYRFPYSIGDRVCQLLVRRRERIVWNEVDSIKRLSDSERGEGGFGSTGK